MLHIFLVPIEMALYTAALTPAFWKLYAAPSPRLPSAISVILASSFEAGK